MSRQVQELDVARQEGKAGKGQRMEPAVLNLCFWRAASAEGLREPRLEAKSWISLLGVEWEHEALPAGSSEPKLQIAPSLLGGVSQAH